MTKLGLRIDVDTFRGTKLGVPALCDCLATYGVKGSFFFSVGPDNMGRHLWRLFKPAFLLKMLRSNAPNLYGWDIILRGTLLPGPLIGEKCIEPIRRTARDGHEIGLHAWDHHAWQTRIEKMDDTEIYQHLKKAADQLTQITGAPPSCSATPGWRTTTEVLRQKERFPFRYNSDCRGESIFLPQTEDELFTQPQIPTTLPTYDELIGQPGISTENYNDHLLSLLRPNQLNVLTIHAEVEGIACHELFCDFLKKALKRGIQIVPLCDLLPKEKTIPAARIAPQTLPGREGWLAFQQPAN